MINIVGDTHTHTIACGHAMGTLTENAIYAKKHGLRFVAITEHSGNLPAAPIFWFFPNMLWHVPRVVEDVVVLRGAEVNIVNVNGEVDFPEDLMKSLDIIIASVHFSEVFEHGAYGVEDYTNMYCKVAENPLVDVIGHCGDPRFEYDFERIIQAFKKYDKIVEINAASPKSRKGGEEKDREIVRLCKRYGVKVTLASDAHAPQSVGMVQNCIKLLEEEDFPEELIVNANYERFRQEMFRRRGYLLPE